MTNSRGGWTKGVARLFREPTIHFFILGGLLFLAHRLVIGDGRVIIVSAGLKADLERRLRDEIGRRPSPVEVTSALERWKRDEALYREALRQRLDREDATIRTVLADKLRARAVMEMPKREPTDAMLDAWLASHRQEYETPRRYDFESVAFPRTDPAAQELRAKYQRALAAGAHPSGLGRSILSGTLTSSDLKEKFGPALSESICGLPLGEWQTLESQDSLLLVRLRSIEGGLPDRDVLRPRLLSDWLASTQRQAVESMTEEAVRRYRFEEQP